MTIPQSSELHANQQNDVYHRMGGKSKKLNFDERLQLIRKRLPTPTIAIEPKKITVTPF